jgi:hypothetical protein
MHTESDCTEALTVTFEWTLRGLKDLFDSTKGDKKSKSKVTKSLVFGNGKWQVHVPAVPASDNFRLTQTQILFYANAGQQKEGSEGGFISLFLACEVCIPSTLTSPVCLTLVNARQPTTEEKEAALAGRRVDRGPSTFQHSLHSIGGYGEACTDLPSSFESENSTFVGS